MVYTCGHLSPRHHHDITMVVKSTVEAVEIPEVAVHAALMARMRMFGDRVALVSDAQRDNYSIIFSCLEIKIINRFWGTHCSLYTKVIVGFGGCICCLSFYDKTLANEIYNTHVKFQYTCQVLHSWLLSSLVLGQLSGALLLCCCNLHIQINKCKCNIRSTQ
jgi:hypothetical protein